MATAPGPPTVRRRMSAADYLAQPPVNRPRTELIYGEVVVAASPTHEHQSFVHNLGEVLRRWTRQKKLGSISFDLDMVLDEAKDLVYRPDLQFLAADHAGRRRNGRVFGPADLCVEVLSPSDTPWVQKRKFSDYERYGIPWYWTIQPEPDDLRLEEHELVDGAYACRTEVVGDAWFAPAVFPGLIFRLPPLVDGDLKAAVKGQAKRLM